jgi:hypothetical protein
LSASVERRRAPVPDLQELIRRHGHRFPIFLGVGVLGLITTFAGTVLLYHGLHLPLWLGSAIAIQLAILVTYTLNSLVTWRDRRWGSRRQQVLTFEAVSLVGMGINEALQHRGGLDLELPGQQQHHLRRPAAEVELAARVVRPPDPSR